MNENTELKLDEVKFGVTISYSKSEGVIAIEKGLHTVYHRFNPSEEQKDLLLGVVRKVIDEIYGCTIEDFIGDFFCDGTRNDSKKEPSKDTI